MADDLPPLSLREKATNKRFNKLVDRLAAVTIAVGLALFAYGVVQELLSRKAPPQGVRWPLVLFSGLGGGGAIVIAVLGAYISHRRED